MTGTIDTVVVKVLKRNNYLFRTEYGTLITQYPFGKKLKIGDHYPMSILELIDADKIQGIRIFLYRRYYRDI